MQCLPKTKCLCLREQPIPAEKIQMRTNDNANSYGTEDCSIVTAWCALDGKPTGISNFEDRGQDRGRDQGQVKCPTTITRTLSRRRSCRPRRRCTKRQNTRKRTRSSPKRSNSEAGVGGFERARVATSRRPPRPSSTRPRRASGRSTVGRGADGARGADSGRGADGSRGADSTLYSITPLDFRNRNSDRK